MPSEALCSEISVIRSQYNMQDPESKTGFYNAIAKKLLEFPEKLGVIITRKPLQGSI